jgi:hypothetical protein
MFRTIFAIVGAVMTVVLVVLGYKNKEKVKTVWDQSDLRRSVVDNDDFRRAFNESGKAVASASWHVAKCSAHLVYKASAAALQVVSDKKTETEKKDVITIK